jgi:hypothetical protein
MQPRVLFILKRREDYSQDVSYSEHGISTGLLNSATFVNDMLLDNSIQSQVAVVTDNNDIDREVTAYRPTHVIIEALWVVPEKFEVLTRLHPSVRWIVRFHSETPFIASEGIAMKWALGYMKHPRVELAINAPRFLDEMQTIMQAGGYSKETICSRIHYLPNYYPVPYDIETVPRHDRKHHVDVGCFGAIRPLKNQLLQAIAALQFAAKIDKKLRFHINIGRTEMKGEPILHNLHELFEGLRDNGHELVIHEWMSHDKFLQVVKTMDIGMQVAFSETFNIVAADMVTSGVPIVVSKEVPWASAAIADPTNADEIARTMLYAWNNADGNVFTNVESLMGYVDASEKHWLGFLADRRIHPNDGGHRGAVDRRVSVPQVILASSPTVLTAPSLPFVSTVEQIIEWETQELTALEQFLNKERDK